MTAPIRGKSGRLGQLQNETWPLRYAGWASTRAPRLQRTARAIQFAGATGISRPNLDPPALPGRGHDRQARGLPFLRSTPKLCLRPQEPDDDARFQGPLKCCQCRESSSICACPDNCEDPERLKRIEARSQTIEARNIRIAERERDRRETIAREVAERAAAEAAEAAAREAARKAEEEARATRLAEQERLEAAEAAKRETILAARRAGRKAKKEASRILEQPQLRIICHRSVLMPIAGRWRRTAILSLVLPSSQVSVRAILRS